MLAFSSPAALPNKVVKSIDTRVLSHQIEIHKNKINKNGENIFSFPQTHNLITKNEPDPYTFSASAKIPISDNFSGKRSLIFPDILLATVSSDTLLDATFPAAAAILLRKKPLPILAPILSSKKSQQRDMLSCKLRHYFEISHVPSTPLCMASSLSTMRKLIKTEIPLKLSFESFLSFFCFIKTRA